MSIKQFQQELQRGFPHPIYLLHSSGDFLLSLACSGIREMFQDNPFNFDTFDFKSPDDTSPLVQIIDILNTLPFLSDRRVVIMDNIQKLQKKEAKKLAPYLADPAKTSLLVMLYEGKAPDLFDSAMLKNIKVIALNIAEKDIPLWIKTEAKKKDVDITDRAVECLMNFVGTNLGMLHAEIEKFSSSNGGVIDIKDIKEMVYAGAEYNAFDLIGALKKGDGREVFRIFENISKNIEPQMLLGALNWQFSRFSGQKEGVQSREIFKLLHEADVGIKTSRYCVMENLLIKLLNKDK